MTLTRAHSMPFGAEVRGDGVRFRLWAPAQRRIAVALERGPTLPMAALGEGWHELATSAARAGDRYCFVLEDGTRVPDPASRYQPEDVHGPSEVIEPRAYRWSDGDWSGRPWEEAVIYELHVGTFTPAGTFAAAAERLPHLVELGATCIELMPIADFPGTRNWGYDGVLPFAPDGSYGRPEDLKALIDAAHRHGLMVLLDVVYNHFGPDGNYLPLYAPQIFTDRHKTPWGNALNFDGPDSGPVRELVVENALYWIDEFHFDGLRLDAVHSIIDESPRHVLIEIAERVRAFAANRHVHLVLENDENDAKLLTRDSDGRPVLYTAQWNDDVHHGLHAAVTGEHGSFYADYHGDTAKLARALAEGFAFQGETMRYRGRARGTPCRHLPPTAFVSFVQNHDQIGNRPFGDRLVASVAPDALRAMAAVCLLAPQIPLLFMGEEWAAPEPFPFFCDFAPELAAAVRQGRREEFACFPEFADEEARERIPDPTAPATFRSAKLDWSRRTVEPHAAWLDWYRRILRVRHAEVVPRLARIRHGGEHEVLGECAVAVRWSLGDRTRFALDANLSGAPCRAPWVCRGHVLWREGHAHGDHLGPWTVIFRLEPDDEASA